MTRYDKRFAKDSKVGIASDQCQPIVLPRLSSLRSGYSTWSAQYDNNRVLGYEALNKYGKQSLPSTGDALKSGWSATNLALYGTSSIGYLGSIIEKTNVEKF
jgi:hypothetical protein